MNMESLIADLGYWAVLIGTFFEGETILVLGGFAAHEGYLRLDLVILSAFVGSFSGDQLWFWLSRRYGKTWLAKHPTTAAASEKVGRLLDRWGDWFVLSFRFMYGLRAVSTVAIGMSSIAPMRFMILNLIAAAIWAAVVGALGYAFGQVVQTMLGEMKAWEHRIWAGLAIAVAVYVIHRLVRHWTRRQKNLKNEPPSA